jgi:monoterpene epsilon-lactone hydrolase
MLALRDNDEPLPAAGVLLSPVTDLSGAGDPASPRPDAGLPVDWAGQQKRLYLGDTDPHLPLVSPYYADLRGLPPLLLQVGGDEWLLHDARRFAPKAQAAGVDLTLQVYPGMWHVWHILVPFMPESSQAVAAIGAFVRGLPEGNDAPANGV